MSLICNLTLIQFQKMSIINNSGLKRKFNFSVQKIDLIVVQRFPPIFVENLVKFI